MVWASRVLLFMVGDNRVIPELRLDSGNNTAVQGVRVDTAGFWRDNDNLILGQAICTA